jgi:hypothetical protein
MAKSKSRHGKAAGLRNLPDGVEWPSAVKDLIRGSVINLSAASDFYKKKAEVAALLQNFVEALPGFHYRLNNNFDRYFFLNLHLFLRNDGRRPADALAEALFFLGRQWAKIDYGKLPIAVTPSDEFLRSAWTGAADWDAFLICDGCIGQSWWHNLGADGRVHTWSGGFDPSDFSLRIDFEWDTTKPPSVMIRVKGEPATILMKWWMTLNPNSPPQKHEGIKELRKKADSVLDSIVGSLKTNLKLTRLTKGRPRIDFGEQAAYLLDHERQSISLIAKRLCQLPQDASASVRRQCFDRIRKAANNYYKLLGSDYTALTSVRVRERIIRIPGNPNAVKSE